MASLSAVSAWLDSILQRLPGAAPPPATSGGQSGEEETGECADEPAPVEGTPAEAPPPAKGNVTGNTSGVGQDILDFLDAVSAHYGLEIKVISGLRDKNDQARVMWNNWTNTLDRGNIYSALKGNPTLREKLDGYWVTAHEDPDATPEAKTEAEASFKAEIVKIAGSLSLHLTGRAVDLPTNLDTRMVAVLDENMHFLKEKNSEGSVSCYHFDSKSNLPSVTDAMKANWPA